MAGHRFERTPAQVRRGYVLVKVRVDALERGLAETPGYHVGKGGAGPSSIPGRYRQARDFVAGARDRGAPIHAPEGGVDRRGRPFLDDGRHRFAALRDSGAREVEVAVPRGQAARFRSLFGGGPPPRAAGHRPFDGGRDAALNQRLAGLIEPAGPAWRSAAPSLRREFYEHAGDLAVKEKRAELARAIGSNGRTMRPRKRPRRDGAAGPVLTPHDSASRTARLLAARARDTGVTLFWHAGLTKAARTPWGVILGYHAAGRVRGAPVRDARLSTRGINSVRKELAAWWASRLRQRARREAAGKAPVPAPPPSLAGRAASAVARGYRALRDGLRGEK